ncbi:MAG: SigE family RNA polymerase sigma factor [Acidimicrobiales bacterium]|nr:SigE family RNA polymerase sigma factor [Acidimicrobiales bacterium]
MAKERSGISANLDDFFQPRRVQVTPIRRNRAANLAPIESITLHQKSSKDEDFGKIFSSQYKKLCFLATMLLYDPSGAEEVVQDAFATTYNSWAKIKNSEARSAYLRTCVVNGSRSRNRRVTIQSKYADTLKSEAQRENSQTFTPRDFQVYDAVNSLAPKQREVVVLRFWSDLSEKEISMALGCSVGTVKSQLSKAKSKLEALLETRESDDFEK